MVTVPEGRLGCGVAHSLARKHWSAGECGEASAFAGSSLPLGGGWLMSGDRPQFRPCVFSDVIPPPQCLLLLTGLPFFFHPLLIPCRFPLALFSKILCVLAEPWPVYLFRVLWLVPPLLGEAVSSSPSCFPSDSKCFPASSLGPSGETGEWLFRLAPEHSGWSKALQQHCLKPGEWKHGGINDSIETVLVPSVVGHLLRRLASLTPLPSILWKTSYLPIASTPPCGKNSASWPLVHDWLWSVNVN